MLRRIVLSSAIVLLVSAGAFADITQLQGYIVGATNGIDFLHGHQDGQSSHTICINNDQVACKRFVELGLTRAKLGPIRWVQ
jgi:hypothetical protein